MEFNAGYVTSPGGAGTTSYGSSIVEMFDLPVHVLYGGEDDPWETTQFGSRPDLPFFGKDFNQLAERYAYSRWTPPGRFDTIITNGFLGKEINTHAHQRHIHLSHGVHRGAYGLPPRTNYATFPPKRLLQALNRKYLKRRERRLLTVVDTLVVNSEFTADMMERFHGITVDEVIHPPTKVSEYYNARPTDEQFYLFVGRLNGIKRVDEIVRTFNDLPYRLVVAGSGSLESELRTIADDNVEILGYVSEERKRELMSKCAGFIQNTIVEDFGMTSIEALASGAPLVAVNDGFNSTIVTPQKNGVLFDRPGEDEIFQTAASEAELADAVERAESIDWDHEEIAHTATEYDWETCREHWRAILTRSNSSKNAERREYMGG